MKQTFGLVVAMICFGALAETKPYVRVVVDELMNPMEMSIASNGDVFIAERMGAIKLWDAATDQVHLVATLAVDYGKKGKRVDVESGLMGIALDPGFDETRWIYTYYSLPGDDAEWHDHCLSRFTYDPARRTLVAGSEKVLLRVPSNRLDRIHEAGSIAFGPDGLLYLSVGDNQIRSEYLFSCKTSANSNDLRGKILRIRPLPDGSYEIPEGNLFSPGTPKTRPEIYVMGLRNPFRISVDQKTGWLLWGENGPPDYWTPGISGETRSKVPLGFEEFNLAKKPGFYGYPLVIADQKPYVTIDYEKKTVGPHFDPAAPVNDHPENTGITHLPPSQPPLVWYAGKDKNFPQFGRGGESAISGHRYHWNSAYGDGLPKRFDGCWFVADFTRQWVKALALDADGKLGEIIDVLPRARFGRPLNVKIGPKGRLHVLYWGDGGLGHLKSDGRLIRLEHKPGDGLLSFAEATTVSDLSDGLPQNHAGTKLMKNSDCLACHQSVAHSVGPTWDAIRQKYEATPENLAQLVGKVKAGGAGVWGALMMPPHPQHTDAELKTMLEAIFNVEKPKSKKQQKKLARRTAPSSSEGSTSAEGGE